MMGEGATGEGGWSVDGIIIRIMMMMRDDDEG